MPGPPAASPLRLTLVSHARTSALRTAAFPGDEPLDTEGARLALLARGSLRVDQAASHGCSARTRQTAEALGLAAAADPGLRDLDVADWRGRRLDELPEDAVLAWLTDPSARPHGGESVLDLLDRVRGWLAGATRRPGRHVAVTHPAVVRAALVTALGTPPSAFWRIDVAPLTATVLHGRAGSWTLRQAGLPLQPGPPAHRPAPARAVPPTRPWC